MVNASDKEDIKMMVGAQSKLSTYLKDGNNIFSSKSNG